MRVEKPCDWIIERLRARRPFFSVRYNDGEMQMMFETRPEGEIIGTDANPAPVNYELGNELKKVLAGMSAAGGIDRDSLLVGCSWGTDRADDLAKGPFNQFVEDFALEDHNWCNEHWPLDGVVDGSTRRMLEELTKLPTDECPVLVTNKVLADAGWCFNAAGIDVPSADSWQHREFIYYSAKGLAKYGCTFVWAAGVGLKPTAWRLFKEFPQSSHIDVGHLFNGAFGLRDYGWLQRQDGPWWEPYFRPGGFAEWVRSFI